MESRREKGIKKKRKRDDNEKKEKKVNRGQKEEREEKELQKKRGEDRARRRRKSRGRSDLQSSIGPDFSTTSAVQPVECLTENRRGRRRRRRMEEWKNGRKQEGKKARGDSGKVTVDGRLLQKTKSYSILC